jgi:predicted nucleotidyltransferase
MAHRSENNPAGPLVLEGDRLRLRDGLDLERWAIAEVRRVVLQTIGDMDIDAYLFGSRVTGGSRPFSDIDIALDGQGRPLPGGWLAELRERLEASLVPFDVEVVDLAEASPAIRRAVFRDGIKWTI